jgi:hypothetical protein
MKLCLNETSVVAYALQRRRPLVHIHPERGRVALLWQPRA